MSKRACSRLFLLVLPMVQVIRVIIIKNIPHVRIDIIRHSAAPRGMARRLRRLLVVRVYHVPAVIHALALT